jgi:hypothetical protein
MELPTTCDWCAIDLDEETKAPDQVAGEIVCYACYLTYWWEYLKAALEDSPPQT